MAFKQDEMNDLIAKLNEASRLMNGVEYWSARDLQQILDYKKWDKFTNPIEKAKEACRNSGVDVSDHFKHTTKTVQIGKGAKRKIEDMFVSNYGLYLLTMHCETSKFSVSELQKILTMNTDIVYDGTKKHYALCSNEQQFQHLLPEETLC